ncbi:putative microtubule binding protein HOOK3 [Aspergillus clavatus NRRL 1]|uniref:Microtubule binding protein HOOK3, putative n=1 Tax=Aspergillus clavatus (strain ATCC 1007 / CBS 513.65 / DSM 816 / NCTC 3887 / NRRL 1 / QM 1276 / 107) TaxID=344612 RepID=A1CQR9_ASPCL|nr:microtubule binding protein HOOK3, putative [Aspergillus clavatus NRRL 1]EAW07990.1 microtubule binding protein HOOK3, putative [Aspergillus clavatus NRRL 1]
MASEHTITQALLEWINSFSLGKTLRATEELNDGTILWEILQDIDPQYFLNELPERNPSDHWVAKLANLKHIHKHLTGYLRMQTGKLPSGLDPSPDLQAIAEKNSVKDTNKLLKLLLIAAIRSPNPEKFVSEIQNLSLLAQEGLKVAIEESNGELVTTDVEDEISEDAPKQDLPVDLELQFEERVGKVIAENDRLTHEKKELEKALEDLHNRLARLQENNDTLQTRLASTEDRLVTLKSGKGDIVVSAKALESKTRQQEDLIASQEERIAAAQDEIDGLRMTVESLHVKNQRFQKLQDDYDELKTERDQLARKANAAEKYRQKLQASQDFEKENQTLKNQIKDVQQQLKDADSQQRWSAEREVELEEYRRVLPRIEQECSEIQNLKKQLEFNNHALTERLSSAEEQRERDDALISELRDRIRELEGSPGSPSLTAGTETPKRGTLHEDFEGIGIRYKPKPLNILPTIAEEPELTESSKSENDELRKEVESLKEQPTSVSQSQKDSHEPIEPITNNTSSPQSGSQYEGFSENFSQVHRLAQANSSQCDEYWKLYDHYTQALGKLSDAQDSLDITKRALADAMAEGESLIYSKYKAFEKFAHGSTVGLVSKEKVDMIHAVKESNSAEVAKMRAEWDELSRKIHLLEAELDASQELVREVCAERDELRSLFDKKQVEIHAEDQEMSNEMKRLLVELTSQSGESSDASQKSGPELAKEVGELIEKYLEKLAKRAEYIHHQNEHIKFLQDRITHFEEDDTNDGISKERELELQKVIDNQARELALVSSAWFDTQSRLQNNNVTVSRYRHGANMAEFQKGWLGRQRSMVAGR